MGVEPTTIGLKVQRSTAELGGPWLLPGYLPVMCLLPYYQILGSIEVSISACHAEDPGSIPGRGTLFAYP